MRLSVRKTFFIILVIGLFLMTLRPIADPDFWWHLKTGEFILINHAIPHTDPFSYTMAGHPWITHEWLSEITMYFMFKLGGTNLLVLFFSIVITFAFILTYFRSEKETRPFVAGFVLLLGAIASAPTWGVRPQMYSLFMTSLFLFFLDRYHQKGNWKLLVPLPILMVIWVNLHGGFFLGLVLIAIYIIGGLIEALFSEFAMRKPTIASSPSIKVVITLSIVLGICAAATLINPNGIQIALYPFKTMISPSMQQLIQEWLSPNFHDLEWQPFAWLLLALIGVGMLGKKTISPAKIILALVLGYAALRSMRNIPLFAVAVIPLLSEQLGAIIKIPESKKSPGKLIQVAFTLLIICFLGLAGYRFLQMPVEQGKIDEERFPKNAVAWIKTNDPQGNVFNTYSWGGYLIWNLFPDHPVFIDGRADVYGDDFLFGYNSIYRAESGWNDKLLFYEIKTVIIEPASPLANSIKVSSLWEKVYEDDTSIIFLRK